MTKKKWIITAPGVSNPLKGKGGKGDSALIHSEEDLKRRLKAARDAGENVTVREAE